MVNRIRNLFRSFHIWLIQLSHGRLGTRFGGQKILLLHTTGRKTGKEHVTPVGFITREGDYYVIGSNWGKPNHAAWYHNLLNQPQASIEVGGESIPITASEVQEDEYDEVWKMAVAQYAPYSRYKTMTSRHIPIMQLKPAREFEEQ